MTWFCAQSTQTRLRLRQQSELSHYTEMRKLLSVVICCSLLQLVLAQEETEAEAEIRTEKTEILWTRLGAVRGLKVTEKEATHYQLLGVPYAEPPVGKLRFRPPAPVR